MLRVDGIDVAYGDVQVLWDVSLEVREGEIVALIGANGSGKTTTLMTISGLLPTAKGGVLAAIAKTRPVPVYFIGVGEQLEDLQPFDAEEFVDALLS